MDQNTASYYAQFAEDVADRYDAVESKTAEVLSHVFRSGMRVLDVGAGSGRDVAQLIEMGCDAYGIEPCDELRQIAKARRTQLTDRFEPGALPQLGRPFGGNFDGVLCSAVLMHLPKAEILDAAISLRDVLRENGKLLLSIPLDRPGLDWQHRDRYGRLFTPLSPDYLQLLFERIGFNLLEKWETTDTLGREGHSWCTFLFVARHPGRSRALELIEGVLNNDLKTATYKLALFRALSEIATTEFEQADWVADSVVGIPVSLVCEKWIYYYWPLFESSYFIPQIRGEKPNSGPTIAFRRLLSDLIALYQRDGGLTRFVLDLRSNGLPDEARDIHALLQRKIQDTILDGPVTHAGGSLEAGRLFNYDTRSKEIRFNTDIWRELSLVGHWIHDATILRWAELTSEISKMTIRPSAVIDLLLTVPIPERDVADAKGTFLQQQALWCTWTGAAVDARTVAIDHIIPFSLWHNNDLWNLVPASRKVNSAKSDKLPTRELMHKRKDCLVGYWELLRSHHKSRFDHEATRVSGQNQLSDNWQTLVFQAVSDAIEFTAVQRGYERWQP